MSNANFCKFPLNSLLTILILCVILNATVSKSLIERAGKNAQFALWLAC